jgi:hypothetical protein
MSYEDEKIKIYEKKSRIFLPRMFSLDEFNEEIKRVKLKCGDDIKFGIDGWKCVVFVPRFETEKEYDERKIKEEKERIAKKESLFLRAMWKNEEPFREDFIRKAKEIAAMKLPREEEMPIFRPISEEYYKQRTEREKEFFEQYEGEKEIVEKYKSLRNIKDNEKSSGSKWNNIKESDHGR